jgi:hypothetical protein
LLVPVETGTGSGSATAGESPDQDSVVTQIKVIPILDLAFINYNLKRVIKKLLGFVAL